MRAGLKKSTVSRDVDMYTVTSFKDPVIEAIINREYKRQLGHLELIASENFVSEDVLKAMGSVLTNKYAEGYPGARYYGGCDIVDEAENVARDRAKELFGAAYANVQPHSGSNANLAVFMTLMKPGNTLLGMDLAHGGHLTHGSPVNFSGKIYKPVFYGVRKDDGRIDYEHVQSQAVKHQPKVIVCGGSAYSRHIDFARFREIADEVGAFLWADIAHPAGLIAAGLHPSPIPHCDIVTTTTHKTLRGPRGGLMLMGKDVENRLGVIAPKSGRTKMMSELFDSAVMPGAQGGPLMHVIASKAVGFFEALQPGFKTYAKQVIDNAQTLAAALIDRNYDIISGGTDNHLMLVDLSRHNITGKEAENRLQSAGITVNKNMVPFDTRSPFVTSGIRIGTSAMTTRGFAASDMHRIAEWIDRVILDEQQVDPVRREIEAHCADFPIFADRWKHDG